MSKVKSQNCNSKFKATAINKNAQFDILVIGSGIAGLNFSLRAAEKGCKVLIITKGKISDTATSLAQGGIAACLSQADDFKKHIQDTLLAGCHHNDKKAVKYMVKNGPRAIKRLIELGVKFNKTNSEILLAQEGGHSRRRIAFVADHTGQAIEKALIENVKRNKNIAIYENTFVSKLLVSDSAVKASTKTAVKIAAKKDSAKNRACIGAQILHKNKFGNIFAAFTVLATGGAGQLYLHTVTPLVSTGDGIALAHKTGAKLKDLEFMQFHPTALRQNCARQFLISEAVRGEGAFLLNSKGKRFMGKMHRLSELAPRDITARAIYEEEKRGQVWLDLRHKGRKFLAARFPQIYKTLKRCKIDMAKDLIPITPAAHYLCGGINVNLNGETSIKGLYAFGETACTGVHGANRLASNSLLEALVFSERATQKITRKSVRLAQKSVRLAQKSASNPTRKSARNSHSKFQTPNFPTPKFAKLPPGKSAKLKKLKLELQKTMWGKVGIVRSKKSLNQALKQIKSLASGLKKISGQNKENRETMELENMLKTAGLIARASQKRTRSLGCHYLAA